MQQVVDRMEKSSVPTPSSTDQPVGVVKLIPIPLRESSVVNGQKHFIYKNQSWFYAEPGSLIPIANQFPNRQIALVLEDGSIIHRRVIDVEWHRKDNPIIGYAFNPQLQ